MDQVTKKQEIDIEGAWAKSGPGAASGSVFEPFAFFEKGACCVEGLEPTGGQRGDDDGVAVVGLSDVGERATAVERGYGQRSAELF
jgi:hypothetical protein